MNSCAFFLTRSFTALNWVRRVIFRYNKKNEIRARYLEKQGHLARLDEKIAEREGKRNTLEEMIQVVCGIDEEEVEFDEELWGGLLDHIVVKEDGQVVVVFKGGIEITVDG